MTLEIKPNMTIKYVNEVFSFFYPNLKLVFFVKTFVKNQKLADIEKITDEATLLKDIALKIPNGKINISDDESTANFESDFDKYFGLHVQVFRKSGKFWLLTTLSDEHTLIEQEENAEISLLNQ